jgi:hypothetical protein
MIFLWCIGMAIAVIGGVSGLADGQKIIKCPAKDEHKQMSKYRVGRMRQGTLNGVPILLLQISVEPIDFNRDGMIALAKQLNRDFCNVEHLNVAICDNYSAAKDASLIVNLLRHEANPALRGFYDIDRTKNKEGIDFSTKRGRPLDEMSIDLCCD